jgi:hypothetical protein
MKMEVMQRTAYEQEFGLVGRSGPRVSEETFAVWEKLKKLTVTEYLLIETENGEAVEVLARRWYSRLHKHARRMRANFKARISPNRAEGHIVISKEALTALKTA